MTKLHYGWYVCLGATLMLFSTSGCLINAFAVYLPFIIQENGFTNTQGSSLVLLRSVASVVGVFLVNKYFEHISLRAGSALAVAMGAVSYVLYALFHSYLGYCFASIVSGLAYSLGGMVPASILIVRWFKGHRALALGMASAGSGVAAIVAPPLLTKIIMATSVEFTFVAQAALGFALALGIYLLVRNSPEEMKLEPVPEPKEKDRASGEEKKTVRGKKTFDISQSLLDYKLMFLAIFLLGAANSSSYGHLGVLFRTEEFPVMQVAWGMSMVGITLTFGKCIYGEVTDRLGAYRANLIFFSIFALGTLCCALSFLRNTSLFYFGAVVIGLGFPITTVGISVLAADMSTLSNYGGVLRNFQIAAMMGALATSILPGVVADYCGSYTPAYMFFFVLVLMSTGLIVKVYRRNGLNN